MSIERLVRCYARFAPRIVSAEINPTIAGDPDDDAVLACALAAQADLIVSGDSSVRNLKTYHGIRIMNVTGALTLIPKP